MYVAYNPIMGYRIEIYDRKRFQRDLSSSSLNTFLSVQYKQFNFGVNTLNCRVLFTLDILLSGNLLAFNTLCSLWNDTHRVCNTLFSLYLVKRVV